MCRASHAALLAPIADQLEGASCTRLMVVLPSEWSVLPLEAAVPAQPASGDPIHRVSLLPAFSFGEGTSRRERRDEERLLIVGYRGSDLERAEAEAASLVELFGSSATYLHGDALTKRTIVEHLNGEFDFVHLICHGAHDSAHPMESSLYFDNASGNDSVRLRARELELLTRMPRKPVVTLSACSTALTAQSRSNTWNGLPGSLLRAGAHAIIASRWPVHDDAAATLMNSLYQQIRTTDQSVLQCFHLAQAGLRDSGAPIEDWACFGYLGRP